MSTAEVGTVMKKLQVWMGPPKWFTVSLGVQFVSPRGKSLFQAEKNSISKHLVQKDWTKARKQIFNTNEAVSNKLVSVGRERLVNFSFLPSSCWEYDFTIYLRVAV